MRQTTIIYEQIFGKQPTPEKRDNSSEWVHRLRRCDACSVVIQPQFILLYAANYPNVIAAKIPKIHKMCQFIFLAYVYF